MQVKNISIDQLDLALKQVNTNYDYKLMFNRYPERKGNFLHFTIKSEKSGIKGARLSWSGRKLTAASWHAHGYLFDAILDIEPKAVIKSLSKTIDINGGNWNDWNCGSMMQPVYMSETSIL